MLFIAYDNLPWIVEARCYFRHKGRTKKVLVYTVARNFEEAYARANKRADQLLPCDSKKLCLTGFHGVCPAWRQRQILESGHLSELSVADRTLVVDLIRTYGDRGLTPPRVAA